MIYSKKKKKKKKWINKYAKIYTMFIQSVLNYSIY